MERRNFLKLTAAALAAAAIPLATIDPKNTLIPRIIRKEVMFTGRHLQSVPKVDLVMQDAIDRSIEEAKHEAKRHGWTIVKSDVWMNTQPNDMDMIQHSLIFECA